MQDDTDSDEFMKDTGVFSDFTMIPNVVIDMLATGELSPIAFGLYATYLSIADSSRKLCKSSAFISQKSNLSTGSVSKLRLELEKGFKSLNGKSLIEIKRADKQSQEPDTITIVNIWPENKF